MSDAKSWRHHNPVRIECAPLETLARHVTSQHVLLVTTQGFVKRGVAQLVKDLLKPRKVSVWDGVRSNPGLQDLDAATQLLRRLNLTCVVGLGGGSALDAAKVLATTIPSKDAPTLAEIFRNNAPTKWQQRLELVVIPTTSGTGSEVTPFATIWDHSNSQKYSLSGDFVYPDVALLDPMLTMTLGEEDTLYPALDAISHALESLWNKNATPVSKAFAIQSLSLSHEALAMVIKDPQNSKARKDLQASSVLAGLAISQTRTAIAHAISYPITSLYKVPHGLACSFGLCELIKINFENLKNNGVHPVLLENVYKFLEGEELVKKLKAYGEDINSESIASKILNKDRIANYNGERINDYGALLDSVFSRY